MCITLLKTPVSPSDKAFAKALGDKKGIARYADAFVPMDETLAHVVLDFFRSALVVV